MVRASAICRGNTATFQLIDTHDAETPTGLQLLAKSSEEMLAALRKIETMAIDPRWHHFRNICTVDLNFGCPSPDVINIGAGPAMLKRKARITQMLSALVEWKRTTSLPNIGAVGCKIRLGLNASEQSSKVYLRVVEAANVSGLDYLTVHARHAKQRSRDLPTWSAIKEIRDIATMPIIGNGNVTSLKAALQMKDITGCDTFMLARAAIRNPWIFEDFCMQNTAADVSLERWPSVEEIDIAVKTYFEWSNKCNTKVKFVDFHRSNFERMRSAVLTGNRNLAVVSPKTQHLS